MKSVRMVAGLVILAGGSVSIGQPVVDGQRSADTQYVQRWLQDQPTSFGDNRADLCTSLGANVRVALNNSNIAGVDGSNGGASSGAGVTTGIEIAIPLVQLGNPVGNIRVTAFNSGGSYDYLSNQVLNGYPPGTSNLGGDGAGNYIGGATPLAAINFNSFAGNQFIEVTNNSGGPSIGSVTVDGTADASYGAALWEQSLGTGFGDGSDPDVGSNNGSEIDGFFAKIAPVSVDGQAEAPYLVMVIAGNVNTGDFNKVSIFIDTGAAGGQNVIAAPYPGAEGISNHQGLTFDTGFAANFYISVRAGGGPVTMYTDFAKLSPGEGGGFLGGNTPPNAVVGTGSACPPNDAVSVGSELDGIYSYLDTSTRRLYVFASGNLKQDQFLHAFFDLNGNPANNKGQNTIGVSGLDDVTLVDNVQIGIPDHLHKFNADGTDPGLTFETNFYADYWIGSHFENVTRTALDAAVLRNEGKQFYPFTAVPLDYGTYSAAEVNNIIPLDGSSASGGPTAVFPGINLQDSTAANIFSGFAPRASNATLNAFLAARGMDPFNPVPTQMEWETYVGANPVPVGLLQASYRNNNVVGVTEASGAGAAAVTTGLEYSLSTSELGWANILRTNIRMVGFITDSSSSNVSNQITGGSGQTTDLGNPRLLNLQSLGGVQTLRVAFCLADFNQSGSVTVQDLFDYLAAWFAKVAAADVNGATPTAGTGVTVQDLFDYLAGWFGGQCLP